MGRKNFLLKTHYERFQKFRCPLRTGFWHYSPNGCCLYIDDRTHTIHHLYLRESCSLTRDCRSVQRLLEQKSALSAVDTRVEQQLECEAEADDERFLNVVVQPYLNNISLVDPIEQRVLNNLNSDTKSRLLAFNDNIMQQFWFVVCDTRIDFDTSLRQPNDSILQHLVIKRMFGPLVFCSSPQTLNMFFGTVTQRFMHEQMPVLNNIAPTRLMRKIVTNIRFIKQFPAQRMLQHQATNNLFYLDARDLFDIVKLGHSGFITNMRTIHLTNENNFLDTWRRILFNFVHELTNIHSFERQTIRIRSSCNVWHFLKGNNRSVIPEFRCDADVRSKCVHLKSRRKEYEMMRSNTNLDVLGKQGACLDKHTLALSDEGVICRFVLETMVDEYGEEAVDKALNFNCYFNNDIFEHDNTLIWQRIIHETLNIDRRLVIHEGSALPRERIACMQILCSERRMNDIHRFCLPKRFLTLAWFKWACDALKLDIFPSNEELGLSNRMPRRRRRNTDGDDDDDDDDNDELPEEPTTGLGADDPFDVIGNGDLEDPEA